MNPFGFHLFPCLWKGNSAERSAKSNRLRCLIRCGRCGNPLWTRIIPSADGQRTAGLAVSSEHHYIWTNFHGSLSNNCYEISFCTKVVDRQQLLSFLAMPPAWLFTPDPSLEEPINTDTWGKSKRNIKCQLPASIIHDYDEINECSNGKKCRHVAEAPSKKNPNTFTTMSHVHKQQRLKSRGSGPEREI